MKGVWHSFHSQDSPFLARQILARYLGATPHIISNYASASKSWECDVAFKQYYIRFCRRTWLFKSASCLANASHRRCWFNDFSKNYIQNYKTTTKGYSISGHLHIAVLPYCFLSLVLQQHFSGLASLPSIPVQPVSVSTLSQIPNIKKW